MNNLTDLDQADERFPIAWNQVQGKRVFGKSHFNLAWLWGNS
jgi:hypothetical protein